jgi:23S rRNA (cytidine1920-2'-O)/16S rRNA (cytidine1409-2'-O)-methyltransferase
MAGDVLVNGAAELRAGALVGPADSLSLRARPRFVSRGGEKLAHALSVFSIDPGGLVCADVGASTGGFTDCLLQHGAARVYAIDVGYGQLDASLRGDPKVVVMDRVNARYLEMLPESVALATIDVSFISLALVLPPIARALRDGGVCIPLIKPQFEAGRRDVGKGGVVRDPEVHRRVIWQALEAARGAGLGCEGLTRSPITGPAGNVEFLAHLVKGGHRECPQSEIDALVESQ